MAAFPQFITLPHTDKPILELRPHGNADIILFYPGSMLGPGHYSLLLAELWKAGLGVAALHLSGHGKCMSRKNFTFSTLLQQGICAEQWLISQSGNKIAVCGHSQGGILALAHAGISHTIKASFPICAIFPQMDCAIKLTRFYRFARYRGKILRFMERLSGIFPELPVPLPFYLNLGRLVAGKEKPCLMGKEKGRISYPVNFLYSLFTAKPQKKCQAPVYIISAKNDNLFTEELITETFDNIDAHEKRNIWLEKGGHMAPFNPRLCKFIAAQIACECACLGMRLETSGEDK